MGLDAVEIVMKVEETFDIAIEDREAEKILTQHVLIELVMSKVGRTDRAVCLTQRAFHRFRASLIRNTGFKCEQIKPDASMIKLFVSEKRKQLLSQLLNDIGLSTMPEFVNRVGLLICRLDSLFALGFSLPSLCFMLRHRLVL
jgi:hypothetical protein